MEVSPTNLFTGSICEVQILCGGDWFNHLIVAFLENVYWRTWNTTTNAGEYGWKLGVDVPSNLCGFQIRDIIIDSTRGAVFVSLFNESVQSDLLNATITSNPDCLVCSGSNDGVFTMSTFWKSYQSVMLVLIGQNLCGSLIFLQKFHVWFGMFFTK